MPTEAEYRERIAYLEGMVHGLSEALERRSRELRLFQKTLSNRDLVRLDRLAAGLAEQQTSIRDLELLHDTFRPVRADVEQTLTRLWRQLAAARREEGPTA